MEIKLLVDSGNSQVKWVVLFREHPGENLLATSARVDVKTVLHKQKQGFFKKLILKSIESFKKYSTRDFKLLHMKKAVSVCIASVAPNALNKLVVEELGQIFPQQSIRFICTEDNHEIVSDSNHKFIFKINRKNPEKLGVDRWLAMLGLREQIVRKKLKSAYILSVGTATVLDKITIKKSQRAVNTHEVIHEGGYIIPGFSSMERSLEFLTTKLETINYQPMEFPSSTVESSLSGICIVQAAISLVTKSTAPIFLYGGNLDRFLAALNLTKRLLQKDNNIIVDPWLVFKGLNQLADRHPSHNCSPDFLQNS